MQEVQIDLKLLPGYIVFDKAVSDNTFLTHLNKYNLNQTDEMNNSRANIDLVTLMKWLG
jgi:hypothetical protein